MTAKLILGITGGIASGKSTVSSALVAEYSNRPYAQTENLSGPPRVVTLAVIDADKVGHGVYDSQESDCYKGLVRHFGPGIVNDSPGDGSINRKALGSIVFSDPEEMKQLQAIVWPAIASRLKELIDEKKATDDVIVVEAAILFEAGWDKDLAFDVIITTQVEPAVARERLMTRNALNAEEADKRISSQMSNQERASRSNVVIDNSGGPEDLKDKISETWGNILAPILGVVA